MTRCSNVSSWSNVHWRSCGESTDYSFCLHLFWKVVVVRCISKITCHPTTSLLKSLCSFWTATLGGEAKRCSSQPLRGCTILLPALRALGLLHVFVLELKADLSPNCLFILSDQKTKRYPIDSLHQTRTKPWPQNQGMYQTMTSVYHYIPALYTCPVVTWITPIKRLLFAATTTQTSAKQFQDLFTRVCNIYVIMVFVAV